jgi:hypothetical protein
VSHILCIDVDVSIFQLRTLMPESLSFACVLFLIQRSVCDFHEWQVKLDHQASSLTWYLRVYQSSLQIATTNGLGLYGWFGLEGTFPTSVTDPTQPMGKVGMCFHPEQDCNVTVWECTWSQVGCRCLFLFTPEKLC